MNQTTLDSNNKAQKIAYSSPFIIIAINCIVAIAFGKYIGKWAFLPVILIEWILFAYFIKVQGESNPFSKWLSKPKGSILWLLLAVSISFPTILIFLKHYTLLNSWEIILPWVLIFLINPFMEEFYWRGFLLDKTSHRNKWLAILFSSLLFSANHYVFAIHSELFRGFPVLISTFLMGFIWALVYQKTKSLRWTIIAHFIVDFLNLSVPSFLDLYEKGW